MMVVATIGPPHTPTLSLVMIFAFCKARTMLSLLLPWQVQDCITKGIVDVNTFRRPATSQTLDALGLPNRTAPKLGGLTIPKF